MYLQRNGVVSGVGEVSIVNTEIGVIALTNCCEATGKGSMADSDRPAVVCRKCYREVDMMFGDASESADELVSMLQGFASESDARDAWDLLHPVGVSA